MDTITTQKELTSIRDLEWGTRQRKVITLSFLATGLCIALILGLGTFLVN